MKHTVTRWRILAVLTFVLGCNTSARDKQQAFSNENSEQAPFALSLVATGSGGNPVVGQIYMGKDYHSPFYVILTNTSSQTQAAFESWDGWGCQAISFEMQTADGHKFIVTRKRPALTRNVPSTFLIPAGEPMVYSIALDDEWAAVPAVPRGNDTPITIKAIYEIKPTPESAKAHVWTGRVESKSYEFRVEH
ncbi:MAG TPA: hypothetical protein VJA94_21305 [Candidatus Angelobacter sp.]